MTVSQRIIQGLAPFRMPIAPGVDTKHRERCFTYNYDLVPYQFTNNRPTYFKALVQVHLILPLTENSVSLRLKVAQALAETGFTWPECIDATDDSGQHYVFECEALTGKE